VHLSIILVINNLMHKYLFYNKFIICLYMFRALCAHHQEVKIVLYNILYHYTCRWPSGAQVERVLSQPAHRTATYRCDDTRCCIIQFWPPDDEQIVLETCRGILYTWVRALWIEFNNCPTRCHLFSLLHFCRQLYMFRVLTPIIRSLHSCNYSFWYWLSAMRKIRCY